MIEISGYKIIEEIYEEIDSIFYRAFRKNDNMPVIIKIPKSNFNISAINERFTHDYKISSSIDLKSVVKSLALEKLNGKKVLVLEDFGGISIKRLMNGHKLPLDDALKLSIKAVKILNEIHEFDIIHKNVTSHNFILNNENGILKISDFGISTTLRHQITPVSDNNISGDLLAYISPEQTGRINRSVDYRTDFYSLGITLYEWFTGHVPFKSKDPMELIHAHIAKQATSPSDLDPTIPVAISNIILKLLSKVPEERYQSAYGLEVDLKECQRQLMKSGVIKQFNLEKVNVSNKLNIPEILYGRDEEVNVILDSFNKVCKGNLEVLAVSGYSGVGKSALVNEVRKPVTLNNGYFISGKFDQLGANIAYSAISQAFRGLIKQILDENEKIVEGWRSAILSAVGSAGQVIIELIPELEQIIGKQPKVIELGPIETRNRFNLLFLNFVKAFTKNSQPLVLFLDDLQWSDSSSLLLLKLLATDSEMSHLFIICAYRDNEVNNYHPAIVSLEDIRNAGISMAEINLSPLHKNEIVKLISDTLSMKINEVASISEVVFRKTEGNPFFTKVFLHALYEEGILHYSTDDGWQWDMGKISEMEATENVVQLMALRISSFPSNAVEILKSASCLGNTFNFEYLMIIHQKSREEILRSLSSPLNAGMILTCSETTYKFIHDRIQEAAYALIPEHMKAKMHIKIAELLLENSNEDELNMRLFTIVEQYNTGRSEIINESDKIKLAKLNLEAGLKAKVSAAFSEALFHFTIAKEMILEKFWSSKFELTYEIFKEKAEAEYLNTNFEEAENLFKFIITKTNDPLKKTRIYEIMIDIYTSQNRLVEAVQAGLYALGLMGVEISEKPDNSQYLEEIKRIKEVLRDMDLNELADLPEISDSYTVAMIRILLHTWAPAYIAGMPELTPLLIAKMTSLSLERGHTKSSPLAYSFYGTFLAGDLSDYNAAYTFGLLSQKLLQKFDAIDLKCRVFFNFAVFINHWKMNMLSGLEYLIEAYQSGLKNGDLQFSSYSINHYHILSIFGGRKLTEIEVDFRKYRVVMAKAKQMDAIQYFNMFKQLVQNLEDKTEGKFELDGGEFDEEVIVKHWIETHNMNTMSSYYILKTMLYYLYGNNELALANGVNAGAVIEGATGMIFIPLYHFFHSLALIAAYKNNSMEDQKKYLEWLNDAITKMEKWSESSPENYKAKYLIVKAEYLSIIENESQKAEGFYKEAITIAEEGDNLFDVALINELFARFWLREDEKNSASHFMIKAFNSYVNWGAVRKAKELEYLYEDLINSDVSREMFNIKEPVMPSTTLESLDLSTVIKASQAISSEIDLGKLITRLMKIIIENAGAERGYLIIEKYGELFVDAYIDSEIVEVLQTISLNNYHELSKMIIKKVLKAGESVIIQNAVEDGLYKDDSYIVNYSPKSILCKQICYKSNLIGILYLENRLISNAFTSDRIRLLDVLLSQAAISIENARLFSERKQVETALRDSETKFRGLVESSQDLIWEVNQDGIYTYASPRFKDMLGYDVKEIVGKAPFSFMIDEDRDKFNQMFKEIIKKNEPIRAVESTFIHKDGYEIILETNGVPFFNGKGKLLGYRGTDRNITERKLLEEQLRQSEKMQAIGQLAGGVAHDFNNQLAGIVGYTDLLRDELSGYPHLVQYVDNILIGTKRAADLTSQLLAFARKGKFLSVDFDINKIIIEVVAVLQRTIDKRIVIKQNLMAQQPHVMGDPTQIQNAIMNIALNARDAMQEGGTLEICTSDIHMSIDQCALSSFEIKTGNYILLNISDTGTGMDENTINKIFEPFFTTKDVGKGTGMGLASVYGTIRNHGGAIEVESKIGKGTTMKVYLPQSVAISKIDNEIEESHIPAINTGSILLIDDEDIVAETAAIMLKKSGFNVTVCANGKEAVEIYQNQWKNIDLVIIDMVMPEKNGKETFYEMKMINSKIRVLISSGYSIDNDAQEILNDGGLGFIQKPFRRVELVQRVSEILSM